MNVLLTSAGRRGYLVKYFQEALESKGDNGKVHVSNSTKLCSAFKYADHTLVSPKIYDEEYIDVILQYCLKNKIKLIIPLFDIDLLVLSKNKDIFKREGIIVVVSNTNVIKTCNDKWLTYKFLLDNGFHTPKTYIDIAEVFINLKKEQINFPLILKPRWGMGSISVFKADTIEELVFFNEFVKKQINNSYLKYESKFTPNNVVLIQEMVIGQEYGLDIVSNLNGDYMSTFVKRKIEMRSGETDISELIHNHYLLQEIGKKIANKIKHVGNLDIDVLYDGSEYKILDMNARFGGGYPFTHKAGVNLPKAILDWLSGDDTEHLQINTINEINYKSIEII